MVAPLDMLWGDQDRRVTRPSKKARGERRKRERKFVPVNAEDDEYGEDVLPPRREYEMKNNDVESIMDVYANGSRVSHCDKAEKKKNDSKRGRETNADKWRKRNIPAAASSSFMGYDDTGFGSNAAGVDYSDAYMTSSLAAATPYEEDEEREDEGKEEKEDEVEDGEDESEEEDGKNKKEGDNGMARKMTARGGKTGGDLSRIRRRRPSSSSSVQLDSENEAETEFETETEEKRGKNHRRRSRALGERHGGVRGAGARGVAVDNEHEDDDSDDVSPPSSFAPSTLYAMEVGLYALTGILLIFVMEQFIQIGIQMGMSMAIASPYGYY